MHSYEQFSHQCNFILSGWRTKEVCFVYLTIQIGTILRYHFHVLFGNLLRLGAVFLFQPVFTITIQCICFIEYTNDNPVQMNGWERRPSAFLYKMVLTAILILASKITCFVCLWHSGESNPWH